MGNAMGKVLLEHGPGLSHDGVVFAYLGRREILRCVYTSFACGGKRAPIAFIAWRSGCAIFETVFLSLRPPWMTSDVRHFGCVPDVFFRHSARSVHNLTRGPPSIHPCSKPVVRGEPPPPLPTQRLVYNPMKVAPLRDEEGRVVLVCVGVVWGKG